MKTTKILVLGLLIGVALARSTQAAVNMGVAGSPHDFATNSWSSRQGVCSPCHSAHNTDSATPQTAPLWAHATSVGPFTPYSSPTLNAAVASPSGSSLACLSCHDGSLAITTTAGAPLMGTLDPKAVISADLHRTHPISFTYDSALAALDPGLEDPSVYQIGHPKDASKLTVNNAPVPSAGWTGTSLTDKTIDEALLTGGKMQCSSCHDVHKMAGTAPSDTFMRKIQGTDVNGRGSLLCRTCHIK